MALLAGIDIARASSSGLDPTRPKTLEQIWSRLIRHFGTRDVGAITIDDLDAYVATRRRSGARGQTIRREVQAYRRAATIAKRRRMVSLVADAPRIKSDPPLASQRGQLHPPAILAAFVKALHPDARDEVELALRTGLRAAELKRLRAEWVEPAPTGASTRFLLRVPAQDAKSRRERVLGLTDAAAAIIRRRLDAHPDSPFVLFQGSHRSAYRLAAKAIGYDRRIKLRDLRHTFATYALAGTSDPWAALESLGHRDLRTTSMYQHTTEARAAATAAAAEKLLEAVTADPSQSTGTSSTDEQLPSDFEGLDGGRGGFRTHDPRLVRPLWSVVKGLGGSKIERLELLRSLYATVISYANRHSDQSQQKGSA
jgi:integrase